MRTGPPAHCRTACRKMGGRIKQGDVGPAGHPHWARLDPTPARQSRPVSPAECRTDRGVRHRGQTLGRPSRTLPNEQKEICHLAGRDWRTGPVVRHPAGRDDATSTPSLGIRQDPTPVPRSSQVCFVFEICSRVRGHLFHSHGTWLSSGTSLLQSFAPFRDAHGFCEANRRPQRQFSSTQKKWN
jgi:hypothetical protein